MPVIDPVENVLHPNESNTAGNSHAKRDKKRRKAFIMRLGHGSYDLHKNEDRRNIRG